MIAPAFQSRSLGILDYRCQEHLHGPGAEEECEGYEVVLPREGMFVRHVEGVSIVADPNHALFFNRGECYRVSHPAGGGDRCTVLHVSAAWIRDCLGYFSPDAESTETLSFPRTHTSTSPAIDLLHRRLLRAARTADEPAAVEEVAFDLLAWLLNATATSGGPGTVRTARGTTHLDHLELIEATKLQLASSLSEKLRLEKLASAVHSSPFHLCRIFRSGTGVSLSRYHRGLRLRTALERVLEGEDDLTRLALDFGFAHHSHFTNSFRKEFGLTPSACRDVPAAADLRATAAELRRRYP